MQEVVSYKYIYRWLHGFQQVGCKIPFKLMPDGNGAVLPFLGVGLQELWFSCCNQINVLGRYGSFVL